ncbi:hypothetical protein Tco_1303670 [Tanacetum coccineum]
MGVLQPFDAFPHIDLWTKYEKDNCYECVVFCDLFSSNAIEPPVIGGRAKKNISGRGAARVMDRACIRQWQEGASVATGVCVGATFSYIVFVPVNELETIASKIGRHLSSLLCLGRRSVSSVLVCYRELQKACTSFAPISRINCLLVSSSIYSFSGLRIEFQPAIYQPAFIACVYCTGLNQC